MADNMTSFALNISFPHLLLFFYYVPGVRIAIAGTRFPIRPASFPASRFHLLADASAAGNPDGVRS